MATQAGPAAAGAVVFGSDALLPIALLSDCAVHPAAGPSPPDVLPYDAAGKPAPGTFRLGVSPGMDNVRRYFKPSPEAIAELTGLLAPGDTSR